MRAGEIRRGRQARALDRISCGACVERVDDPIGPRVLPDDGVVPGRPVFGFQTTVVSRWFVTPIAARSAAVELAAPQRAGDRLVGARGDLQRIVLDPSGLRHDLIVLDLVPRDFAPALVEHHEPRARRPLIDRSDVTSQSVPPNQLPVSSFQFPVDLRAKAEGGSHKFNCRSGVRMGGR